MERDGKCQLDSGTVELRALGDQSFLTTRSRSRGLSQSMSTSSRAHVSGQIPSGNLT